MNGSAAPAISVVIPVFNALRFLPETIPAIEGAVRSSGRAELIVVDNGSTDGSWEWLQAHVTPGTTLTRRAGRVGALRNEGVTLARADVIAFLDADCLVAPDYLDRALDALARTSCVAVGSRYALPDEPLWIERSWEELHASHVDGPISYINSGNLVVRRSAFDAVGGFDATLESGEDAELCFRLRAAGHCLLETQEVRAVHLGNPKSLRGFYRKQLWHGKGALGTARIARMDKPLIMTMLHVALIAVALIFAAFSSTSLVNKLLVLIAAALATPVAAVLYRCLVGRRLSGAVGGVPLYFLYFTARAAALASLAFGRRVR